MANVGHGTARQIIDSDGDVVGVTDNALDVNIAGGTTIDIGDVEIKGHQDIAHGSNTSVSDTTAEYLYGDATSVACKHIDIMASISNTGIIYVGATGVTAATGIALYAGDVYSVDIENIRSIFVIASVDTEEVEWVIYN